MELDMLTSLLFCRTRSIFGKLGIPDFDRIHVQVLGAEDSYGKHAIPLNKCPREVSSFLSCVFLTSIGSTCKYSGPG
jgi:hypothetical protein